MRRDRTGRTAMFASAGFHGILVLILWTTVSIAARPPEPGPREFAAEMVAAVPLPEPPQPPEETPEVVLADEPDPVPDLEEVTPESDLALDPLFAEPAPHTVLDSSILLPSSPCRAAGVLRPRRVEPVPVPTPPAPRPQFSPAPPEPAGITCVAAPANGNRRPRYPDRAIERGYEGVVLLLVVVRPDGTVEDVRVLETSGHVLLDRAALRAVRDWRFTPAKRNGRPVADEVEQAIRFELE